MRLYTICKYDNQKFYVASHAKVRSGLPPTFYLTCPYKHTNAYLPQDVYAEVSESNIAVGGALAGGIIGLLAGGIGAITGAILGGLLGGSKEKSDSDAVIRFNSS